MSHLVPNALLQLDPPPNAPDFLKTEVHLVGRTSDRAGEPSAECGFPLFDPPRLAYRRFCALRQGGLLVVRLGAASRRRWSLIDFRDVAAEDQAE
ncbi:MAG: hypothetical protein AAF645_16415 [Myxococcota bacterium]